MQNLYFVKTNITKLYLRLLINSFYLPYKYLVIKAFTSGRTRFLYFLRFFFSLQRVIPKFFLMFLSYVNILAFTALLRGSSFFIPLRFWILILHHFRFFFEALITLRLITGWLSSVNLHQGGTFEQIIFNLSEPYFKAFEEILPRGLSALFSYYLIEVIGSFIEMAYRAMVIYAGGSRKKSFIENVDLFTLALSGETLLNI